MQYTHETIRGSINEIQPLLKAYWEEIAHYKDIPLDPDFDQYLKLEEAGLNRFYVVRNDEGKMIGYANYFLNKNLHYKNSIQALQDVLFIDKKYRGTGIKFILWCDEQLKSEGVQVVHHHTKAAHDFGVALKRFGYELVDMIYAKRLDK